jgi:ammonium transporter, Amt family
VNAQILANNLWVIIAGLLVFTMTIAVGFLEVGELGDTLHISLLKTILVTGLALVVMGVVGFNTAFAPTLGGFIGNPLYGPGLLIGGFSATVGGVWWSTAAQGLQTGTYFLFETAFASVTLALVGVIILRKVKLGVFLAYAVVYFVLIWNLPAAWIWNPSGWLAKLGMVDFAGGLVVHGAAGAAGLAIMYHVWREERSSGLARSAQLPTAVSPGWLTLGILLLWVGWFGFNPGSVLAFNQEAIVVVVTTFLAAAAAMVSLTVCGYLLVGENPGPLYAVNGILMGLIIITPLAGFVSPASAVILGLLGGPLFVAGERVIIKIRWLADPVGLLPGHLVGGVFGVTMIAFFTQAPFAAASGFPTLPNGLLFGGGGAAVKQLGIEVFGILVVIVAVYLLSYVTVAAIKAVTGGILARSETSDMATTGELPVLEPAAGA